jgi:hypothetical protein
MSSRDGAGLAIGTDARLSTFTKPISLMPTYLHVIYAGRGDAMIIEDQGKFYMLDGGPLDKAHGQAGNAPYYRYLLSAAKWVSTKQLNRPDDSLKPDAIIISHAHDDHYGGLLNMMKEFLSPNATTVASKQYPLVFNGPLLKPLNKSQTKGYTELDKPLKEDFKFVGSTLSPQTDGLLNGFVLGGPEKLTKYARAAAPGLGTVWSVDDSDENVDSILMWHQASKMVFTGDSVGWKISAFLGPLLNVMPTPTISIFKVPHHGSLRNSQQTDKWTADVDTTAAADYGLAFLLNYAATQVLEPFGSGVWFTNADLNTAYQALLTILPPALTPAALALAVNNRIANAAAQINAGATSWQPGVNDPYQTLPMWIALRAVIRETFMVTKSPRNRSNAPLRIFEPAQWFSDLTNNDKLRDFYYRKIALKQLTAFYSSFNANAYVISADGTYGHPAAITLAAIAIAAAGKNRQVRVFVTDGRSIALTDLDLTVPNWRANMSICYLYRPGLLTLDPAQSSTPGIDKYNMTASISLSSPVTLNTLNAAINNNKTVIPDRSVGKNAYRVNVTGTTLYLNLNNQTLAVTNYPATSPPSNLPPAYVVSEAWEIGVLSFATIYLAAADGFTYSLDTEWSHAKKGWLLKSGNQYITKGANGQVLTPNPNDPDIALFTFFGVNTMLAQAFITTAVAESSSPTPLLNVPGESLRAYCIANGVPVDPVPTAMTALGQLVGPDNLSALLQQLSLQVDMMVLSWSIDLDQSTVITTTGVPDQPISDAMLVIVPPPSATIIIGGESLSVSSANITITWAQNLTVNLSVDTVKGVHFDQHGTVQSPVYSTDLDGYLHAVGIDPAQMAGISVGKLLTCILDSQSLTAQLLLQLPSMLNLGIGSTIGLPSWMLDHAASTLITYTTITGALAVESASLILVPPSTTLVLSMAGLSLSLSSPVVRLTNAGLPNMSLVLEASVQINNSTLAASLDTSAAGRIFRLSLPGSASLTDLMNILPGVTGLGGVIVPFGDSPLSLLSFSNPGITLSQTVAGDDSYQLQSVFGSIMLSDWSGILPAGFPAITESVFAIEVFDPTDAVRRTVQVDISFKLAAGDAESGKIMDAQLSAIPLVSSADYAYCLSLSSDPAGPLCTITDVLGALSLGTINSSLVSSIPLVGGLLNKLSLVDASATLVPGDGNTGSTVSELSLHLTVPDDGTGWAIIPGIISLQCANLKLDYFYSSWTGTVSANLLLGTYIFICEMALPTESTPGALSFENIDSLTAGQFLQSLLGLPDFAGVPVVASLLSIVIDKAEVEFAYPNNGQPGNLSINQAAVELSTDTLEIGPLTLSAVAVDITYTIWEPDSTLPVAPYATIEAEAYWGTSVVTVNYDGSLNLLIAGVRTTSNETITQFLSQLTGITVPQALLPMVGQLTLDNASLTLSTADNSLQAFTILLIASQSMEAGSLTLSSLSVDYAVPGTYKLTGTVQLGSDNTVGVLSRALNDVVDSPADAPAIAVSAQFGADPAATNYTLVIKNLALVGGALTLNGTAQYTPNDANTLTVDGSIVVTLSDTYTFTGTFMTTAAQASFNISGGEDMTIASPFAGMFGITITNPTLSGTVTYQGPSNPNRTTTFLLTGDVSIAGFPFAGTILFVDGQPQVAAVSIAGDHPFSVLDFFRGIISGTPTSGSWPSGYQPLVFDSGSIYYAREAVTIGQTAYLEGYHVATKLHIFDHPFGVDIDIPADRSGIYANGTYLGTIDLYFAQLGGYTSPDNLTTAGPTLEIDTRHAGSTIFTVKTGIQLFDIPQILQTSFSAQSATNTDTLYAAEAHYNGSLLGITNPGISFTYSSALGLRITSLPALSDLSDIIQFADLIAAASEGDPGCGTLVGLVFDKVLTSKFNISLSMDPDGDNPMPITTGDLRFLIIGNYTVSAAGHDIVTVAVPAIHVIVPGPFTIAGLPGTILNAIKESARTICADLLKQPDKMMQIIAIMSVEAFAKELIGNLLCRNISPQNVITRATELIDFEVTAVDAAGTTAGTETAAAGDAAAMEAAAQAVVAAAAAVGVLAALVNALSDLISKAWKWLVDNLRDQKDEAEARLSAAKSAQDAVSTRLAKIMNLSGTPGCNFAAQNSVTVDWSSILPNHTGFDYEHYAGFSYRVQFSTKPDFSDALEYTTNSLTYTSVQESYRHVNQVYTQVKARYIYTDHVLGFPHTFESDSWATAATPAHLPELFPPSAVAMTSAANDQWTVQVTFPVEGAPFCLVEIIDTAHADTVIVTAKLNAPATGLTASVNFQGKELAKAATGAILVVRAQTQGDPKVNGNSVWVSAPDPYPVLEIQAGIAACTETNEITINWQAVPSANLGYDIDITDANDNPFTVPFVTTFPTPTSCVISGNGLINGLVMHIRIRPLSALMPGIWNNDLVPFEVYILDMPTDLSRTYYSGTQTLHVSWTGLDAPQGVTYELNWRNNSPTAPATLIKSQSDFVDIGNVVPGTEGNYLLTVQAAMLGNNGSPVALGPVSPLVKPPPPGDPQITADNDQLTVTWLPSGSLPTYEATLLIDGHPCPDVVTTVLTTATFRSNSDHSGKYTAEVRVTSDGIQPASDYAITAAGIFVFAPPRTAAITGSPFTVGDTVEVYFTTDGSFGPYNWFTAELSDAGGQFINPVILGAGIGTGSGLFRCRIPAIAAGTGYRIRVSSTDPKFGGVDNGTDLVITSPVIPTPIPDVLQGKFMGYDIDSNSSVGCSVAISSDGNTAIAGGYGDNSDDGAAWIFTRNNGSWTQQSQLYGTDAAGAAEQGAAVAISADGNTALIGGPADNNGIGAVWIFTRNGALWNQYGAKLIGSDSSAFMTWQGYSVAISADGNTLVVNGNDRSNGHGIIWIYGRKSQSWSEQSRIPVGTPAGAQQNCDWEVAISADGNTIAVSSPIDNGTGGALIFIRNGASWAQQGEKLIGTGAIGDAWQGRAVALSADGNTLIMGGCNDNDKQGAVWIFTRNGTTWSQQGNKLSIVDPGYTLQGRTVSLSADGNTAIAGGMAANTDQPAACIYTRSGNAWTSHGNTLLVTGIDKKYTEIAYNPAVSGDGTTAVVGANFSYEGGVWMFSNS